MATKAIPITIAAEELTVRRTNVSRGTYCSSLRTGLTVWRSEVKARRVRLSAGRTRLSPSANKTTVPPTIGTHPETLDVAEITPL